MIDDPNFADYTVPAPPDRLLRTDEIDDDFIEALGEVGSSLAAGREEKKWEAATTGPEAGVPLFNDVGRTLRTGIPSPVWLVKRLIERGFVLLFGPSGTMKSFVAMYLAFCIAVGRDFFGRKVERGPVLYICGEGLSGAYRRFAALEVHYKIKIPEGNLFLSRCAVNVDPASVEFLRGEIETAAKAAGKPPALITIDTLTRSFVGDENLQKDMSGFITAVGVIAAEFDCTTLVIHHTGHGEGTQNRARGSSVLIGASDSIIKCVDKTLTWTKTKDSEPPEPIPFASKKIELGLDEDGKPIDSIVIVESGEKRVAINKRIKKAERLALETLIDVCARGSFRDGSWWAGLTEWRAEFAQHHWGDNPKTKEKAHLRSRESLVAMGLVRVENDCYTTIGDDDMGAILDRKMFGKLLETGDKMETNGDIVSRQ